jgi:hypothetical protein
MCIYAKQSCTVIRHGLMLWFQLKFLLWCEIICNCNVGCEPTRSDVTCSPFSGDHLKDPSEKYLKLSFLWTQPDYFRLCFIWQLNCIQGYLVRICFVQSLHRFINNIGTLWEMHWSRFQGAGLLHPLRVYTWCLLTDLSRLDHPHSHFKMYSNIKGCIEVFDSVSDM